MRPRLNSSLSAETSGLRFYVAACKKVFSLSNDQAVWTDRLFQQNRPEADGQNKVVPYK